MKNINWKLVSIGAIVGGLVSAFVWSNHVITIICLILLFISAYMKDEANIADDEVFIRKYYNIYGDDLLKSEELLTKLAIEIQHTTGRGEALFVLRARVERFIYDVQRGKKKK